MRSYWIGVAFCLFGLYTLTTFDYIEASMYLCIGGGFIIMDVIKKPSIQASGYYKFLQYLSWFLILAAVFLFLLVLRRDAYGLG